MKKIGYWILGLFSIVAPIVLLAETVRYKSTPSGELEGVMVGGDTAKPIKIIGTTSGGISTETQIAALIDAVSKETTLKAVKTAVELVGNTVSNNKLQVDVLTLPDVTIGAFPDNEPFNISQLGGSAVGADNPFYIAPGTGVNLNTSNIAGSVNVTNSFALDDTLINGTQKTQVVDSGGEAVSVTNNKLDVNASVSFSDLTFSDTICELTLTDTTFWYGFVLPENTCSFTVHAREGYDVLISKDSDGSQYWTVWAGESFPPAPMVRDGYISGTYYLNCPTKANLKVEFWARYKQ